MIKHEPRVRPDLTDGVPRLKVLDIGMMLAGPFASTLLGDFGADVIKVERPDGHGDRMREQDIYWPVEGRNKRSITLDMRKPEGQALILKLVEWADVFIENFKPGVVANWGLDYATLSRCNPRLVYVSVSGFGQTGPNSPRPGYDHVGAAFGGLWYQTGFPDRPPVLPGLPIADYLTATFAAFGALEAIRRRDCVGGAGKGEWVELGLYEPIMRISGSNFIKYSRTGQVNERVGSMPVAGQPPRGLPQGVAYETADRRLINMMPIQPAQWDRLKMIIPEIDRPEFSNEVPQKNMRAPDPIIRAWIAGRNYADLVEMFSKADLAFSPIYSTLDLLSDPHVEARGNILDVEDYAGTPLKMQGVVPRFVNQPGEVRWAGEALGASNQEVYGGLLGLGEGQIAELKANGVI
ncbi:CaiB/BaiF CoA transferase family protein [Paraburkholderia phytofirmans]|uniref:CaiB/BaiF CoA transferase family protein n=1 Tax=Paraburkholderia phytofirmans TaxID=261302 RepID=UPI0038BBE1B4